MTLTDKEELIRVLELCESGCEHCKHADARYRCEYGSAYETACSVICDAPEIDAEPVVRCKDCRHKNNSRIVFGTYGQHLHHCNELNQIVSDDFFCANAERRTE